MVMWILPWLFKYPWLFVATSIVFMGINLLNWKYEFFPGMGSSDRSNLGTVYFPFAAAIVATLFWHSPPLMVAAMMPLTWGDGLASVVGRKLGIRHYHVFGHQRSFEGSTAFFMAALLWTWLALWANPGSPELSLQDSFAPSLMIALSTTITESITAFGLDNLTVTAVSITILSLLYF
jgi:phytol kinase